jgi:DNA-binding GntR family transcriptional regulator
MPPTIEPLNHQSLKEACIRRLEALILSGQFKIGERLPAERDLAAALNISRPALHEALLDLANKGLVEIVPRRGVYVSDFRVTGSLALLSSLFTYHEGVKQPENLSPRIQWLRDYYFPGRAAVEQRVHLLDHRHALGFPVQRAHLLHCPRDLFF